MELAVLRQLPHAVIVLPKHKVLGKENTEPTGRMVAGVPEYIQGTLQQRQEFMERIKEIKDNGTI